MIHTMSAPQLMQLFEQLMHTANFDPQPEIQNLALKTIQVVQAHLADCHLYPVEPFPLTTTYSI